MSELKQKELKMKMINRSMLILFVVSLLAIELAAQPFGRGWGQGKCQFPGERIGAQLNLTESQMEKVSEIILKHQSEMIDNRSQVEKNMLEMKEMRLKGTLNRKAYLDLVEKNNSIRNKMRVARANKEMDIYELLTDEQKKQWNNKPFMGGRGSDKPEKPLRGRRLQRGW